MTDLYAQRDDLIRKRETLRRQCRSTEIVTHKLALLTVKIIRAELRNERKVA